MRIGLYGLPTAGKSFVLDHIKNLEVFSGSHLLKALSSNFYELSEQAKEKVRKNLALELKNKDNFIMDGHYSFGENVVFTKEDGQLYETFLYLYVSPEILLNRMQASSKNRSYLQYDIQKWQLFEIEALRTYCHENNKDFYVIDNPSGGYFSDISVILAFIDSILCGYSCVNYAKEIAFKIDNVDTVSLIDGDRTFIREDSSTTLGYKTNLFDGNFYTGFQAWRHHRDLAEYLCVTNDSNQSIEEMKFSPNENVIRKIEGTPVILTTGYSGIWKQIAKQKSIVLYYGAQMCSDTKYFITKFIQEKGSRVIAFGDSMNDYYMLKQADIGFLVLKQDGSVSSSLWGRNLEGLRYV